MKVIIGLLLFVLPLMANANSLEGSSDELMMGAKVYRQNCVQCHGSKGRGDGVIPMTVPDYPNTNFFQLSRGANTLDRVTDIALHGCGSDPDQCFMPPWEHELSAVEIDATVAYVGLLLTDRHKAFALQKLLKLNTIPTQRVGRALFSGRCIRCHGEKADGNGPIAKHILGVPPANLRVSGLSFDQLVDIISLGGAGVGRSLSMPPWDDELMDYEIKSVAMYLQSLRVSSDKPVYYPDDAARQQWTLPVTAPAPENNQLTKAGADLGQELFFDRKLSGDGTMSCASCHDPDQGWSDSLKTAKGHGGKVLGRATPSILNAAFCNIQMWDGRFKTLEQQALVPVFAKSEMNQTSEGLLTYLTSEQNYIDQFEQAYPGEGISEDTVAKAIASFQRTVIDRDTRFDRWIQGDRTAMNDDEIRGFQLFIDAEKGNCVTCHEAPNFVDNGFHNLGVASIDGDRADLGRFKIVPIKAVKGAFKTPSLRNVSRTAPYFHDGSVATLEEVVEHYMNPDHDYALLSPNFKRSKLTPLERDDIVAFLRALDSNKQEHDAVQVVAQHR